MENSMSSLLAIMFGALVALVGGLIRERTKRKSAEALNDQGGLLSDLAKADGLIAANKELEASAEAHRKQVQDTAEEKKNEKQDLNSLKKFFDDN